MTSSTVQPHDDPKINKDDLLIRRVDPTHHLVDDENTGKPRISSKLFSLSSEPPYGMSVDVERLIADDGLDPQDYVTTPKHLCSLCFVAGDVRQEGFRVGLNPIIDSGNGDGNPYHAEVWAPNDKVRQFTKSQKKKLHKACSWYVPYSKHRSNT